MKNFYRLLFSIILLFAFVSLKAQENSTKITVQLSATSTKNPAKIVLSWINDGSANGFKIYRRIIGSGNSWGNAISNLQSSSSQYVDNNVLLELIMYIM